MKRLILLVTCFVTTVAALFFFTYTNVSGQADKGWKVWVKTSPCAGGRTDWISIAKENPTFGAGGSYHESADENGLGRGMACTKEWDNSCTFQSAMAVADSIRTSNQFTNYCCHDYSVWENVQTKKMSIVKGTGSAGFGWNFTKGGLCCEEAEALAGIPGACSGTVSGAAGSVGDLSGSWTIVQTDSAGGQHTGILKVTMTGDVLAGHAEWQNHPGGNITGQVRGRTIHIDVHYEGGLVGIYDGQVSSDGNQMVNGKARSNRSAGAVTWVASRLTGGGAGATRGQTHSSPNRTSRQRPMDKTDAATATDRSSAGNPDDAAAVSGAQNWAGTWVGSYNQTVHISGGGSSISASFEYQQPGASGNGQWSNCRITGNTAECNYTAHHDDATKSGSRRGTLKVTLNGDTITGTLYEDEPQWTYKGDRNASNVSSAMYKGAQFPVTFKRQ